MSPRKKESKNTIYGHPPPITAVLLGAGPRGSEAYGRYALRHPDRIKFVAVADIDKGRRNKFAEEHDIPTEMRFRSWEEALDAGKIADVAFITLPDRLHYAPAIRALKLGYDLLLEKPIAPTPKECKEIERTAVSLGRIVMVGHVLRYTEFWKKLRRIIKSGIIGRVIHYEHSENVSYWHFGHSFVRGPFSKEKESNPLILAKTCHDLDLMHWILGYPIGVQSTGSLTFYRRENAPPGAPDRCTDGCPHSEICPWYAPRFYIEADDIIRIGTETFSPVIRCMSSFLLKHRRFVRFLGKFIKPLETFYNWQYWPATSLTHDLSIEGKMRALREGPFGRCIFKCDNDVVDHQIAIFGFPDGVTGVLIVHGFSEHEGREIRIFGTRGTVRGFFRHYGELITVTDFRYRKTRVVHKRGLSPASMGHAGGDEGLMNAFTDVLMGIKSAEEAELSSISSAMESHYMGFAAELSRKEGRYIEIDKFRESGIYTDKSTDNRPVN